jgi:hypothetical protein
MSNINEISREIVKKVVHFNTKFRPNYYRTASTDFKYNFPIPIKNVISMRLRSIDVPNTWYDFSSYFGNTTMFIEACMCWNAGGEEITYTGISQEIVIPDGNYTGTSLVDYINDTFLRGNANGDTLSMLEMSVSLTDLKTRIKIHQDSEKTNSHCKFSLSFNRNTNKSLTRTLGWNLGFRHAVYRNVSIRRESNAETHRTELASEGLFDGAGSRYLYISLNDYNMSRSSTNIIFLDKTFLDKDIIGKMYLWNGKFQINIHDNDEVENLKKRIYNGRVDIKSIHLQILDSFGRIVYLNNMDFSFALEFEVVYEKCQKNYV